VRQTELGSAVAQVAETIQEKSHLLQATFFPELMHIELDSSQSDYPMPRSNFSPVTNDQIHWVISKLGPYKAPGPDGTHNVVLMQYVGLLMPHLGPIYRTMFKLGIYPDWWKELVTIVLRKPTKPDYMVPIAHQHIAMLNMMAKVLSTCIAEDLVQVAKMCNLLPSNHFGCHPRRMTSDSLHYVTTSVKNTWRRKEVISALFLDIKGTCPNVVLSWLIHNMRKRGVP